MKNIDSKELHSKGFEDNSFYKDQKGVCNSIGDVGDITGTAYIV